MKIHAFYREHITLQLQNNGHFLVSPGSSFQARLPQLNGVFVLDKPSGPSSAQCLATFKKLGQKKVGHGGTLDPLATGVLLVLLGNATKLSSYLLAGGVKVYRGMLKLGVETDTWDIQGRVVSEHSWLDIKPESIAAEIQSWTSMTEQAVPPYSAARHNGQPMYKLARQGRDVPDKIRKIKISEADMLEISMPFARFRVTCGSGSYIRSLAHSLGKRLGCGATLCELTREYSHPFGLENATSLETLKSDPELLRQRLHPMESALPGWRRIELTAEQAADARNGKALDLSEGQMPDAGRLEHAVLMAEGKAIALAQCADKAGGRRWAILRGLWN